MIKRLNLPLKACFSHGNGRAPWAPASS